MDFVKTRSEFCVKGRYRLLLFAAAVFAGAGLSATVWADAASDREYQLKAAFLYNFISFVDGKRFAPLPPDTKPDDPNRPIHIGILGNDPFKDAFEPLADKTVRDRPVVVRRFQGFAPKVDADGQVQPHPDLAAIRRCHVLFVCASEKEHFKLLLAPIRDADILTVSDVPGFLDAGGMINFLIEEKKVRFEVNTVPAERAKLDIRSKLLRLAVRVVKIDPEQEQNDG